MLWQLFYSLGREAGMYPGILLEADTRKQRLATWPQISSPDFQLPNLTSKPWELHFKTNHEKKKFSARKMLCKMLYIQTNIRTIFLLLQTIADETSQPPHTRCVVKWIDFLRISASTRVNGRFNYNIFNNYHLISRWTSPMASQLSQIVLRYFFV